MVAACTGKPGLENVFAFYKYDLCAKHMNDDFHCKMDFLPLLLNF
jgi:hypothetical protein